MPIARFTAQQDSRLRTPHSQSGVAAIELAVSMLLLMMMFFAIISYGALFWAQQKLSQLAADGARLALTISYQGAPPGQTASGLACEHLKALAAGDTLIASMGAGSFDCTPHESLAPAGGPGFSYATLRLESQATAWPLLNIMRTFARVFNDGSLLPDVLYAYSTVQIAPGTASP